MTAPPTPEGPETAAHVGSRRLTAAQVDARVAELRAGRAATLLPPPGSAEGRQLRRWVTQLLVAETLVEVACEERGVTGTSPDESTAPPADAVLPNRVAALEVGSVLAALLASSARARALYTALTADVAVTDDEVAAYRALNPEQRDRARVRDELLGAARRRRFTRWLDERRARTVTLCPGFEHPGDPGNPDNTHRH